MTFAHRTRTHSNTLVPLLSAAAIAALLLSGCAGPDAAAGDNASGVPSASELGTILGVTGGESAGKGLNWTLGAALPLSGPGAPEGKEMTQAIDLAIEQIAASGGPTITLSAKDIKGPDPVAATQAIRELADEGVAGKISTYGDGLGSMLEATGANEILTLDGVGGAQPFALGAPFYYGTTAVAPGDVVPGLMKWIDEAYPKATSIGMVGVDMGPFTDPIRNDFESKVKAAKTNVDFNGLWETVAPTEQDFASLITKVKANEPDVLVVGMGAQLPGAFTAQAVAAGITSTIVGIEFTQTGVDASKGTFDSGAYHFAKEYFDTESPTNPLSEFFVSTYAAKYPGAAAPSFYAANAYEDTLAFWQFLRETVAAGGDINSGAALRDALEANPELPSLYGGDAKTVGVTIIDTTTHGLASRALGVYRYKDGGVHTLATFDIGGADFTMK